MMLELVRKSREEERMFEKDQAVAADQVIAEPLKAEVRGLSFYYGQHQVLKNINLNFADRRVTALIGPSGCGKTTLLSVMAGASRMEHGEISYFGRISAQKKQSFQHRVFLKFL